MMTLYKEAKKIYNLQNSSFPKQKKLIALHNFHCFVLFSFLVFVSIESAKTIPKSVLPIRIEIPTLPKKTSELYCFFSSATILFHLL